MSVHINTRSGSIRNALAKNLAETNRAGTALATGNGITHAFEDPTGLAIGSNMKAARDTLSVIATGIQQSSSMLNIAEAGLQNAESIVNQMNTIVARAMGKEDSLIEKTLTPAYEQLKDELNRTANSVQFNGQKLLNGTGGKVTNGIASTPDLTPVHDLDNSKSTVAITSITLPNLTGITVNGRSGVTLSLNGGNAITSGIKVTGGIAEKSGADTVIRGATITIKTQIAEGTNTANADVVLSNVTFKLTPSGDVTNGVLSGAATIQGSPNISVKSLSGGAITSVSGMTTITPSDPAANGRVENILTTYPTSGGIATTSAFKFVTGLNLNKDVIYVSMPNIGLEDRNGVLGVISTLNVQDNTVNGSSNSLSALKTAEDAIKDAPLLSALRDQIVVFRNALGAYQLRFENLKDQLAQDVEQMNAAQGAILDANLTSNAEDLAAAKVKVNIAVSILSENNAMLSSLQRIVTG